MGTINVEIDGLPVEVDEDSYKENPSVIEDAVRTARAAVVGTLNFEPAPDFDELEAIAAAGESAPE